MRRTPTLQLTFLEDRITPTVLPPGFTEELVASGLIAPTAMMLSPDGRIFVAEQPGTVRIVRDGQVLPEPFYDVDYVANVAGETGLLGITLDPAFDENGYVYLYATVIPDGEALPFNRILRVTADGDRAVPGSEVILVDLDPIDGYLSHNGGAMHFGPDGKLYVSTGDIVLYYPSQQLTNRHGKILRYNPDGTIPDDNPTTFAGISGTTEGPNRAIWAVGLRNPFTFAIHPTTGQMFINDVGQNKWEEINEGGPGLNYGWPRTEGDFDPAEFPHFTRPIYAYGTGIESPWTADRFAITGAVFYAPAEATFPEQYHNAYFFGDFVQGWIDWLDPATGTVSRFASDLTGAGQVDLDVTPDGDLLYLSRGNLFGTGEGTIYRIRYSEAPAIVSHPTSVQVQPGMDVTFTAAASGPRLSYQWQRDGVDIPGANEPTLTLPEVTLADNGATFRLVVTNDLGSVTTHKATLAVVPDRPPTATILSPTIGATFIAGQTLQFEGTATDEEDGELPASAFTWRVDYFTGAAPARPLLFPLSGIRSGSVVIPASSPYTSPDVYYRVSLTVRDSAGNTTTTFRDIHPVTADVTLTTNLPGTTVFIDGQPQSAPYVFTGVAGLERQLEAMTEVTVDGQTWTFVGWQDGVTTPRRTISTPAVTTTFTALYEPLFQPSAARSPLVVGTDNGSPEVRLIDFETGEVLRSITDLGDDFAGGVRVAVGDVNGDGVPDYAFGAGPGRGSTVVIIDGATGEVLKRWEAFEPEFTGGVFVALADINGDGRADLIVSPDVGGGPRVQVVRIEDGAVIANFWGIEDPSFRGGARVAAGDVNGDGWADLIVAAGVGGGPRVAGWDGRQLAAGVFTRLFNDFFAFESSLRNGVYLAVGDLTGDGFGEVIAGSGPGGGPRVTVFSGSALLGNESVAVANFFAGDPLSRGGVRVAVRNLNGDDRADLLVGAGVDAGSRVAVYLGATLSGAETPPTAFDSEVLPGFRGGVFVG
jgi:glucose/arabinose dehydrogenase